MNIKKIDFVHKVFNVTRFLLNIFLGCFARGFFFYQKPNPSISPEEVFYPKLFNILKFLLKIFLENAGFFFCQTYTASIFLCI